MKLSIVTTLYRSAATVDEFCRRAIAVGETITQDIEVILVNDGSPDESLQRALVTQAADPRIVVVDLSRNFGQHKAMMAGLSHAHGDLIFLLDDDLEEEPELLTELHKRFQHGDCDVVYCVQEERRGSLLGRAPGQLYFSLLEWLSDEKIPRNLMTARLMSREYVSALLRHRDREFVMSQLWATTGFKQIALSARKLSRSESGYTLRKRIEIAIKHVTTTSTKLLYLILYVGLTVSCLSMAIIIYLVSRYVLVGIGVDGWTTLAVSVWFFGGLITLILGIFGIYIANLLSESKRRPYAVVRRVYRKDDESSAIKSIAAGVRADIRRLS